MTSEVIRILLIQNALGFQHTSKTAPAWSVYTAMLPAEVDKGIVIYDTAGKMDGRLMSTGEQIEHPGIMVRVRGPVYLETATKVGDIARFFDSLPPRTEVTMPAAPAGPASMEGKVFVIQNISRSGSVLPTGVEEGDRIRHGFTLNAMLTIRERTE